MDLDKGSFSSITGRLKLNPLETLNFLFLLCKMSMKSWPISTMHFNLCWNCTRPSERWGFCTPVIPWIWFFSLVKNRRKLFQTAASAVVTKKRGKRWNLIFTLVRVQAKQRALASSFLGSHISWTMSLLTNEEKERIKGLREMPCWGNQKS